MHKTESNFHRGKKLTDKEKFSTLSEQQVVVDRLYQLKCKTLSTANLHTRNSVSRGSRQYSDDELSPGPQCYQVTAVTAA